MPVESAITPLGWTLLGELPAFLRPAAEVRAVQHAYAKEVERLEGKIQEAREQANPARASLLLSEWERTLGLPQAPAALSEAERQKVCMAAMGTLAVDPSATHWWSVIDLLASSGLLALDHIHGDPSSPEPNELHVVVPFPEPSPMFGIISRLVKRLTPAHVKLNVTATDGFLVDRSEMDHLPGML